MKCKSGFENNTTLYSISWFTKSYANTFYEILVKRTTVWNVARVSTITSWEVAVREMFTQRETQVSKNKTIPKRDCARWSLQLAKYNFVNIPPPLSGVPRRLWRKTRTHKFLGFFAGGMNSSVVDPHSGLFPHLRTRSLASKWNGANYTYMCGQKETSRGKLSQLVQRDCTKIAAYSYHLLVHTTQTSECHCRLIRNIFSWRCRKPLFLVVTCADVNKTIQNRCN